MIQYALDHFGYDHDDLVVIMDADVFPIQPMSIRDLVTDIPLIGIDSEFKDLHYLWVPFIVLDPKRLPNLRDLRFSVGFINDVLCDTGSQSDQYLKNNPEVPYQLYPRRSGNDFYPWDSDTFLRLGFYNHGMNQLSWPSPFEFYVDYHLVHHVGGSAQDPSIHKTQAICDLLNCALAEY